MGTFQSAIILKNDIYFKGTIGDHNYLLKKLNIIDSKKNAENIFVRVMLRPVGDITLNNLSNWELIVDQDIIPEWFVKEYDKERLIKKMIEVYQDDDNLRFSLLKKEIKFIKNIKSPNKKMLALLLKQNGLNIQYINNSTEDLQLIAVKQNGCSIRFIKSPSEKVQIEAIKSRKGAFKYIKYPTDLVKKIYMELYRE